MTATELPKDATFHTLRANASIAFELDTGDFERARRGLIAQHPTGPRPVTVVIYTHSHADHFGGVLGVTTDEEVASGRCRVIAPEHFLHEAIAENLLAVHGGSLYPHHAQSGADPWCPGAQRASMVEVHRRGD